MARRPYAGRRAASFWQVQMRQVRSVSTHIRRMAIRLLPSKKTGSEGFTLPRFVNVHIYRFFLRYQAHCLSSQSQLLMISGLHVAKSPARAHFPISRLR